ncbi:uncharacterized protein TNCT_628811 [Trichonephila clavata]|uniref:Uncharacterized protein n=1 Tax=Trichonephila clavata TaxID=2740835 RepID=A0A8X6GY33_TRICU|nr:uncharacterized protein TNCT_628811 [Trichonephila clavata]
MLHYLHLKKFLTAVAFARALGKRPTVLPIPVPIPIPIAQNEVIKIPVQGSGKTMILDGNRGSNKGISLSQLLGSTPQVSTGSTSYGYPVQGISTPNVVNLSSMKGSDSNVINLASLLGSSSNGAAPKIVVLGGQNTDNVLSSLGANGGRPTILRVGDLESSNMQLGVKDMGIGINGLHLGSNGINGMLGQNGINFGTLGQSGVNFGDLDGSFSLKSPQIYRLPYNIYSDKPRRKLPLKFRGRRVNNNHYQLFRRPESDIYENNYNTAYKSSQEEHQTSNLYTTSNQERYKKPIPVGEKFTYRP